MIFLGIWPFDMFIDLTHYRKSPISHFERWINAKHGRSEEMPKYVLNFLHLDPIVCCVWLVCGRCNSWEIPCSCSWHANISNSQLSRTQFRNHGNLDLNCSNSKRKRRHMFAFTARISYSNTFLFQQKSLKSVISPKEK